MRKIMLAALAALAVAGCGTAATSTTTPAAPASTPASTPATSTPAAPKPAAVPVLRVGGSTITVTVPAGLDASYNRDYTREQWTLHSARLATSDTGPLLVLNVTITNLGPLAVSGGNALLGYLDFYAADGSQVTAENPTDAPLLFGSDPDLFSVSALIPGQSTTGDFALGEQAHTSQYNVDQSATAIPVMVVKL